MRRTMKLTFESDEEFATVLEALRRRSEVSPIATTDRCFINASKIAALCREFLDAPQAAAKNGEAKP